MERVLVVEDDRRISEALTMGLTRAGFCVASTDSVWQALATLRSGAFAAAILDVMLIDGTGFELLQEMRRAGLRVPVLMLTARGELKDKVAGLEMGADDYLTKPFALEEVLARVRALLRRGQGLVPIRTSDLLLDPVTRTARLGERPLDLSATEFRLLYLLAANAGRVVSKREILDSVWDGAEGGNANNVEVYVGYLRRKTEVRGRERMIETVRGEGYRLTPVGVEPVPFNAVD